MWNPKASASGASTRTQVRRQTSCRNERCKARRKKPNLQRLTGGRTTQVGAHKSARSAIPVQIIRGRRAVERLDAIVLASYRRDRGVLLAWRSAKRVQRTPGGVGSRVTEVEVVPEVTTQVTTQVAA